MRRKQWATSLCFVQVLKAATVYKDLLNEEPLDPCENLEMLEKFQGSVLKNVCSWDLGSQG